MSHRQRVISLWLAPVNTGCAHSLSYTGSLLILCSEVNDVAGFVLCFLFQTRYIRQLMEEGTGNSAGDSRADAHSRST